MKADEIKQKLLSLTAEINSLPESNYGHIVFNQQAVNLGNISITRSNGDGRLYVQPRALGCVISLAGKNLKKEMYLFMRDLFNRECDDYIQKNERIGKFDQPYWITNDFEKVREAVFFFSGHKHHYDNIFNRNRTRSPYEMSDLPTNDSADILRIKFDNNITQAIATPLGEIVRSVELAGPVVPKTGLMNTIKNELLFTPNNQKEEKMTDYEELRFDNSLEDDIDTVDLLSNSRNIYTELSDPEIESLHGKFKRNKLVVQPDFQRQFVWDSTKASRLIESALLAIPIPVVYISQEDDGKEYVIDGQQRLTTFFSFIDGSFPDGTDFKLTGLKVYKELNGKRYRDLDDELQDDIRYFKIRTIAFRKESDKNLKFEIFERLNTGSVSLNDQELRNCIYRGEFNLLLRKLSVDPDFVFILGLKKPDKRMKDIELVLRFAAFYHSTYLHYKPPMKNFLNLEAERYRNISPLDAEKLTIAFKNACQITRSMFGNNAFKRFYRGSEKDPSGYWEAQQFNASLFDVVLFSFADMDKNIIYQNMDSVREAFISLMTENNDFIDSIVLSTSSLQAVTKRFDLWRTALLEVVGVAKKEPRCFSLQLKNQLYQKNNTCAICGQRINDIDDSAIDHIKQYWLGGQTIPENARLTHRFCNWSRSRKD